MMLKAFSMAKKRSGSRGAGTHLANVLDGRFIVIEVGLQDPKRCL
jgi:hypothetical protein